MKKYLIALLLATCFIHPISANENVNDDEEHLNAFGFPDKSFVKLIKNNQIESSVQVREKPDCNDKQLISVAQTTAKPFIDKPTITIINKRKNILITKNIDNFEDLTVENAMRLDNKIVKSRLTELKINNKLSNKNFKICQSNNPILEDKLFILMYDNDNNVKVEILNLAIDKIPSFYFYDN